MAPDLGARDAFEIAAAIAWREAVAARRGLLAMSTLFAVTYRAGTFFSLPPVTMYRTLYVPDASLIDVILAVPPGLLIPGHVRL